jgi:hypothetical protein
MSIVVVVLLLFAAAGSVMRAPNHLDAHAGSALPADWR